MKKATILLPLFFLLNSCIQNYSNEYKIEVQKICECMEFKKSIRKKVSTDIEFIFEDEEYKVCILDAIINEVDTRSHQFSDAIKDNCKALVETQNRHLKTL